VACGAVGRTGSTGSTAVESKMAMVWYVNDYVPWCWSLCVAAAAGFCCRPRLVYRMSADGIKPEEENSPSTSGIGPLHTRAQRMCHPCWWTSRFTFRRRRVPVPRFCDHGEIGLPHERLARMRDMLERTGSSQRASRWKWVCREHGWRRGKLVLRTGRGLVRGQALY
jgi:hypothetical protein